MTGPPTAAVPTDLAGPACGQHLHGPEAEQGTYRADNVIVGQGL